MVEGAPAKGEPPADQVSRGSASRWRLPLALLVALGLWWLAWHQLQEPPSPPSPTLAPLPDFNQYQDVRARKRAFFDYLLPLVERQNAVILGWRAELLAIRSALADGQTLDTQHKRLLKRLQRRYGLQDFDASPAERVERLLRRVDAIPAELALVQAAKESAWGRSRFAVRANNLFGRWCYQPGCGLVPERRGEGKIHEVKAFASVEQAIADYLHTLNTHPSYRSLRDIRAGLRQRQAELDGLALADGLRLYSQRREAYVNEIKAMIRQYHRFNRRYPAG